MSAIMSLDRTNEKICDIKNFNTSNDSLLLNKINFIESKRFSLEGLSPANNGEFFIPRAKLDSPEKKVNDDVLKDIYGRVNADFSNEMGSFMKDILSLLLLFDIKNKFLKNIALDQNSMVNYLDQFTQLIQKMADTVDKEMRLKIAELEKKIENTTWWSAFASLVLVIIEVLITVWALSTGNVFLLALMVMALTQSLTKAVASIVVLCDPKNQKALDFMQNGFFAFFGSDSKAVQVAQTLFNIVTSLANLVHGVATIIMSGIRIVSLAVITMIINAAIMVLGMLLSALNSIFSKNDNNEQQSLGLTWGQCLSGGIGGSLALFMKLGEDKNKPLSEQENYLIMEMIVCAALSLIGNCAIAYKVQAAANLQRALGNHNPEAMRGTGVILQEFLQKLNLISISHQLTNSSINTFAAYKNYESAIVDADAAFAKGDVDIFQKITRKYNESLEKSSDQLAEIIKALAESVSTLTKAMNQILNSGTKGYVLM